MTLRGETGRTEGLRSLQLAAMLALVGALGVGGLWLAWPSHHGTPACRAGATPMMRLELVFGLSRAGRPDVVEAEWLAFLDREVTPRFPDGLTVLAGLGQWKSPAGVAVREPARLLLVWVRYTPDLDARIEAVREGWKRAFEQTSVLRSDSMDCVSF